MIIQRLQQFIESPYSKAADIAAVATSASYYFPGPRQALHELGGLFTDIAPIAAVLWLLVQIVCKVIVTAHHIRATDD